MEINTLMQAIGLGVVQGLTEFIPVSSSGHLQVIPGIFGWEAPTTIYILFAHLGTLLALVFYFRHKLWSFVQTLFTWIRNRGEQSKADSQNMQLIINILIATIPAGLLGLLLESKLTEFYDSAENAQIADVITLVAMAVLGVVFIFSNRLFTSKKHELDGQTWKHALFVGFAQPLAFIRGTSRSGITLISGQLTNLSRVASAEFSFLMSIPIVAATSLYGIYKLTELPVEQFQQELAPAVTGLLAAMISGYLAIRFLLNYLKENSLAAFGWYRIIFAIFTLWLILS